jgi:DNA-directed RNA polymerase
VEEISQLQSSNSKNLDQIIYDYFANFEFKDNFIYFPIFLDFRGRKYYNSRVGPTSSKILRLAFHYG